MPWPFSSSTSAAVEKTEEDLANEAACALALQAAKNAALPTDPPSLVNPTPDFVHEHSCREVLDAMTHCFTPGNQLLRYHYERDIDDCVRPRSEFYTCMKMKTTMPDEERLNLFMQLKRRGPYSPTKDVWKERARPQTWWDQNILPKEGAPAMVDAPSAPAASAAYDEEKAEM